MIYLFGLITGFVNGLFASGAGQILVFCLIFLIKIETHNARATSVFLIGITAIFTLVRYLFDIKLKAIEVLIVCICGAIFGIIGAKISIKTPAKYLNLLSGILITTFSLISMFK